MRARAVPATIDSNPPRADGRPRLLIEAAIIGIAGSAAAADALNSAIAGQDEAAKPVPDTCCAVSPTRRGPTGFTHDTHERL